MLTMENKQKRKVKNEYLIVRVTLAEKKEVTKKAGGKGKVGAFLRKILGLSLPPSMQE